MAWICSYYADTYEGMMYEGRSMLYWCKREVKWAADYLMKMHLYANSTRPSTWDSETDNLVIQVRRNRCTVEPVRIVVQCIWLPIPQQQSTGVKKERIHCIYHHGL